MTECALIPPAAPAVLVVDGDDSFTDPLTEGLCREGFSVHCVASAQAALAVPSPDIVLVDRSLPDTDGVLLCRDLRQRSGVPIMIVSARGSEADVVLGLSCGADDYLVKPFGYEVLIARMRALLRRCSVADGDRPPCPSRTEVGGRLVVDHRTHRVTLDDEELSLSPKEFGLLAMLIDDPGAIVTRRQLLDGVWQPHWVGPTKTLDVHVASLRVKLGSRAWVETVRGVGFRLGRPPARQA